MGTRIHKTLGWGFRYHRVGTDPRFNSEFFEGDDDHLTAMVELATKDSSGADFGIRWDADFFLQEIKKSKITSICTYDVFKVNGYCDEGDICPCVFTDPLREDWSRYDDIIDYYEAETLEDNVKFILDKANQPAQVYPHCTFVNRHTGECLRNVQGERWWVTELYFENKRKKKKNFDWSVIQKTWPGITNIIQWQRDVVPEVPYNIGLFLRAANPFKNPLTMYRLKPMIYTYWC